MRCVLYKCSLISAAQLDASSGTTCNVSGKHMPKRFFMALICQPPAYGPTRPAPPATTLTAETFKATFFNAIQQSMFGHV